MSVICATEEVEDPHDIKPSFSKVAEGVLPSWKRLKAMKVETFDSKPDTEALLYYYACHLELDIKALLYISLHIAKSHNWSKHAVQLTKKCLSPVDASTTQLRQCFREYYWRGVRKIVRRPGDLLGDYIFYLGQECFIHDTINIWQPKKDRNNSSNSLQLSVDKKSLIVFHP